MRFRFLISDPDGDIELLPEDLERPFLTGPGEEHPFLTLSDYFGALQEFMLSGGGEVLRSAFKNLDLPDLSPSVISEVIIRSEKHGAFYHIASVEIISPGNNSKLAVTTALSESAKQSLGEEFVILQQLSRYPSAFIARVYCKESVPWKTDAGDVEFLMVLGEWLDGCHEWHVNVNPAGQEQKIQLWDYENGYRFLTDAESCELLRQAAFILTYYYDQKSYCQIYPWHHGAGDFVVKPGPASLAVKLITARQYEPLVYFDEAGEADRVIAAIHFLLNLTLRMRLDRHDGIFEPVWLAEFAVRAAVAGFFAGLLATQAEERLLIGPVGEFLEIMQSFDSREIFDMYGSHLEIYAEEDPDDFDLIREKLAEHAEQLYEALQGFTPL